MALNTSFTEVGARNIDCWIESGKNVLYFSSIGSKFNDNVLPIFTKKLLKLFEISDLSYVVPVAVVKLFIIELFLVFFITANIVKGFPDAFNRIFTRIQ